MVLALIFLALWLGFFTLVLIGLGRNIMKIEKQNERQADDMGRMQLRLAVLEGDT